MAFAVVLQFVICFFHRNKKNVREVSKSFHFFCSRVTGTVPLQYSTYCTQVLLGRELQYAELISHLHDCFVHLPYVQPCAIIPLHAIVVANASNG